ncbi:CGNR zinc finger domain-containing protein [Kitasatospora sp. NPDC057223]|uniref:CGNR zinc finger domain-containing protein n=1 Tax=Kitasatospora sp. NPDC057223 TaxID=3346055 RepID=UPI003631609C
MTAPAPGHGPRPPEGAGHAFDPGALCLELLTTGGPEALARHELLHEPDDLAYWLALSRLHLPPTRVDVTDGDLLDARQLRDTLWQLARARAHGRPGSTDDLALLNHAAARTSLAPQIGPSGAHSWALPAIGAQAVATIARDAVDLFTGPFAGRIRECSAHDCHLIFVDTSRPGRRRWCTMETCGNRHRTRPTRSHRDGEEQADA